MAEKKSKGDGFERLSNEKAGDEQLEKMKKLAALLHLYVQEGKAIRPAVSFDHNFNSFTVKDLLNANEAHQLARLNRKLKLTLSEYGFKKIPPLVLEIFHDISNQENSRHKYYVPSI